MTRQDAPVWKIFADAGLGQPDAARDSRPVTISRGELRLLLTRLFVAEERMEWDQARIHAEVAVMQRVYR